MKRTDAQDIVAHRRRLLIQSAQVMEHDRCGPNLVARCGCTFIPWRHRDLKGQLSHGLGLIIECDQANRLFEIAIRNEKTAEWEGHIYLAREDADNQLAEIVKLIIAQRKRLVPDQRS
jgi:hypothetical protein